MESRNLDGSEEFLFTQLTNYSYNKSKFDFELLCPIQNLYFYQYI